MKKVLKYNELNEYNIYTSISEDELLEMANVTDEITGINNVVIWIGPSPPYHWKRIKVSNKANYYLAEDCFTITIPDLKINGDVNTKLITTKIMNNILDFIKLNLQLISDYSDGKLTTNYLFNNLKSIK